jgi:hypothetical protein
LVRPWPDCICAGFGGQLSRNQCDLFIQHTVPI